jgi:Zn-finger nucleic acid-binding protein
MNAHSNMACPIDGTALVPNERQGIEIDYCPTCRGVWLDRGELDKIIERSAAAFAPQVQQPQPAPQSPPPRGAPWPNQYGDHGQYHHKKRRKSFFEELFD